MLGRPIDVIIGVDIHKHTHTTAAPQRHRSGPRAFEGDSDGALCRHRGHQRQPRR